VTNLLMAWVNQKQHRLLSVSWAENSRGKEYEIKGWDSGSGKLTSTVSVPCGPADVVTPSPDLNQFVVWGGNHLRAFAGAFETGAVPSLSRTQQTTVIQFSLDSRHLLIASGSTAHMIDIVSGRALFPSLQHSCPVVSAEFSKDGRYLVTACKDASLTPREAQ